MKKVHIVVQGGLVQEVYVDNPLNVEVVLYDLDTEDPIEYAEIKYDVDRLRAYKGTTTQVY